MPTRYLIIMIVVFIIMVTVGVADEGFVPRKDRSIEQIEKMREELKVRNTHIIESQKQIIVEKKHEVILEDSSPRLAWEDQVQAEPITVRLGRHSDYHDRLASYAYRICKATAERQGINLGEKYSCENKILTWNAENGGWNKFAKNTANRNGTYDGGLCQLNSQRHKPFIRSERFQNPLAQLDYCNEVWLDAARKGTMPFYAYWVRHQRDRGISFN